LALDNQNKARLSSYESKKVNLHDFGEDNAVLHNFIPALEKIALQDPLHKVADKVNCYKY